MPSKSSPSATPQMQLDQAVIGYPQHFSFTIDRLEIDSAKPGQWICLLGPNGCGKTTLLRSLAGLLPLLSGSRRAEYHRAGYVPQRFSPNVDAPLNCREFLTLSSRQDSAEMFQALGVDSLLAQPLNALSGGQLQRVLLAFAILDQPQIVFLDEAMEGLDMRYRKTTRDYLAELNRRGLTIIEVSHDLTSVTEHANRVILIDSKVVFDGSPEDKQFHLCLHETYGAHSHLHGGGHLR